LQLLSPSNRTLSHLCSVALIAVVSGCSTMVSDDREAPLETRGMAAPVEDASMSARPAGVGDTSQAVVALLDQAATQQRGGHPEQSAATLERALRIEPRNPWLWHRLAQLRLQMGMARRAEQLALKSKALAAGNPRLIRQNWLLIAQARETMGDLEGAQAARNKVE